VGNHGDARFVPCFIKHISCSRRCARPLACGTHACPRPCHSSAEPCGPIGSDFGGDGDGGDGDDSVGCGLACVLPRGACRHPCAALCHPGEPCPEVVCAQMTLARCACGRLKAEVPCGRGGGSDYVEFSSTGAGSGVGSGTGRGTGTGDAEVRLACDSECERLRRNAQFAAATGVNADAGVTGASAAFSAAFGPRRTEPDRAVYGTFLLDMAQREAGLVRFVEQQLAAVVRGERKHVNFEGLPSLHRLLVHELAAFYRLDSGSAGRASERSVRVLALPNASVTASIPTPLLSEARAALAAEERKLRSSSAARALVITMRPSDGDSTDESETAVAARVRRLLKAHAGAFMIRRIQQEPRRLYGGSVAGGAHSEGDSGSVGGGGDGVGGGDGDERGNTWAARVPIASRWVIFVEFTSPERVYAVELALQMRTDVHTRKPTDSELEALRGSVVSASVPREERTALLQTAVGAPRNVLVSAWDA